jgi:hypothetical protein
MSSIDAMCPYCSDHFKLSDAAAHVEVCTGLGHLHYRYMRGASFLRRISGALEHDEVAEALAMMQAVYPNVACDPAAAPCPDRTMNVAIPLTASGALSAPGAKRKRSAA